MGQHSNSYLLLFSYPFLVESLLRDFVPGDWVHDLDFTTLEKVGGSYATDDLRSRHDDLVWRVRSRAKDGGWIYVYLILEFQSKDEYFMAVRIMTYVGLLYQDLIRQLDLERGDPLPQVLAIVIYNGYARWQSPTDVADLVSQVPTGLEGFCPRLRYLLLDEGAFEGKALDALSNPVASLFRLEHVGPTEALAAVKALRESLQGPQHQELRRAFAIWIANVLRSRLKNVPIPEFRGLEEVEIMLAEQAPTWNEILEERGRVKGRKEGESAILLRQLEIRFGPLDSAARGRVQAADAERLLEWGERILSAERLEDVFGD